MPGFAPTIPLVRNAVTLSFCQTARSSRRTMAILVSNIFSCRCDEPHGTVPYAGTRAKGWWEPRLPAVQGPSSDRLAKTHSSSTIAADHRDSGACLAADHRTRPAVRICHGGGAAARTGGRLADGGSRWRRRDLRLRCASLRPHRLAAIVAAPRWQPRYRRSQPRSGAAPPSDLRAAAKRQPLAVRGWEIERRLGLRSRSRPDLWRRADARKPC